MKLLAFALMLVISISARAADTERFDTIVQFRSSCPIKGAPDIGPEVAPLAALLAAVAPSLIQTGVDAVVGAIKAQGEDQSITWTAKTTDTFYDLTGKTLRRGANIKCIVIVRGPFGENLPPNSFANELADTGPKLFNELGLVGTPYFYLEVGIGVDPTNSYYRLIPQILYFDGGDSFNWGKKERDLVLTFSFKRPDTPDKNVFGTTTLSFLAVNAGKLIAFNPKDRPTSDWLPFPAPDAATQQDIGEVVKAEDEQKRLAGEKSKIDVIRKTYCAKYVPPMTDYTAALNNLCNEASAAKLKADECPTRLDAARRDFEFQKARLIARDTLITQGEQPSSHTYCQNVAAPQNGTIAPAPTTTGPAKRRGAFSLDIGLTETRNGSQFFKALGVALETSKPGITTALREQLIPSERQAAEDKAQQAALTAAAAKDDLLASALTAKKAVEQAEDAVSKLPVDATTQQKNQAALDVEIAKIRANTAYRNAGIPIPYPNAGNL